MHGRHKKLDEGESIHVLADASGHHWETIWNAPENEELRTERRNPEALAPGDRLFVPDLRQRQEACETDARHRFRRKGVPVRIALTVGVAGIGPLTGKRYELAIEGAEFSGTTDGDGKLDHWTKTAAKTATLKVWPDDPALPETLQWEIAINHLSAVETRDGVKNRLRNLGYDTGPQEDAEAAEAGLATALRAFQSAAGLDPTGQIDDETRSKLEDMHGH